MKDMRTLHYYNLSFYKHTHYTKASQRVIRREPKVECYVLTKVKSPPFVPSFYDVIFFDTYLYVFHKTEDQMVILSC